MNSLRGYLSVTNARATVSQCSASAWMLCFRLFLESERHIFFVLDRVGPYNVGYLVDEQSVVLGSSI